MAKKEKQLAVAAEETELMLPEGEAWGSEELDASDIVVPKLLLMQGLSKFVTDGECSQGQIVDSLSKKSVGGITNIKSKEGKPVDLVAFSATKSWIDFEKIDGQWVYIKTYPLTGDNVGQPQEEIVNGVEVRRDRCMNFYVLLADQIAAGEAIPYVVSFRRTSMRAGKKIATMAAKLKALGNKPLAFKHILLSVVPMQKDDKTFWGFEVAEGANSTPAELKEAYKWHQTLKTVKARVDDADLKEPLKAEAEPVDGEVEF